MNCDLWYEVSFIHFIQPIELEFQSFSIQSLLFTKILCPECYFMLFNTSFWQSHSDCFWTFRYCSRFVLNVPKEDQQSFERILFLVEYAHWFYEDNSVEENPSLKSFTLKEFTSLSILFNIFFSVLLLVTIVQHNLLTSFFYWTLVLDV